MGRREREREKRRNSTVKSTFQYTCVALGFLQRLRRQIRLPRQFLVAAHRPAVMYGVCMSLETECTLLKYRCNVGRLLRRHAAEFRNLRCLLKDFRLRFDSLIVHASCSVIIIGGQHPSQQHTTTGEEPSGPDEYGGRYRIHVRERRPWARR